MLTLGGPVAAYQKAAVLSLRVLGCASLCSTQLSQQLKVCPGLSSSGNTSGNGGDPLGQALKYAAGGEMERSGAMGQGTGDNKGKLQHTRTWTMQLAHCDTCDQG